MVTRGDKTAEIRKANKAVEVGQIVTFVHRCNGMHVLTVRVTSVTPHPTVEDAFERYGQALIPGGTDCSLLKEIRWGDDSVDSFVVFSFVPLSFDM